MSEKDPADIERIRLMEKFLAERERIASELRPDTLITKPGFAEWLRSHKEAR